MNGQNLKDNAVRAAKSPVPWAVILAVAGALLAAETRMGDRPTRAEVNQKIQRTQENIQRELDDIKKRQNQTYEEIKDVNRTLRDFIWREPRSHE